MPQSRRTLLTLAGLTFAGLIVPRAPGKAAPAGPTATIRALYDTLIGVMKQAKRLTFDQRYQRLEPAITRTFNLALMTRIAVGPDWRQLSAAQQHRLVDSFTRYTISTYASRFDGYSGERFEVDPHTLPNPNGVIVATRLIPPDDSPVTLNYLMRQEGHGAWQAIDVYLSGTISELASRRSEFMSVLHREGADGLVRMLNKRVAALRTG